MFNENNIERESSFSIQDVTDILPISLNSSIQDVKLDI